MKLWRAIGQTELDKLLAGKTIKPIRDITNCKNSWTKPAVTFFGTENNAANWFSELIHNYIICIDADETVVQCGKGRYPDFSEPVNPLFLLLFNDSGAAVWVREYAMQEYSRYSVSLVAVYEVERNEVMKKHLLRDRQTGKILQVSSAYDDLVDEKS
ncbi:MAG: hypothetical protein Q4E64_03830 [Phascolarctobacterium sp.]|uniref:hypothetical protein n=1 Tax=Phascolarctobacterium sp. TaxID=2049039 RepID=UPI0026DDB588|nr:hypothetical protein [Phascolarctobacterium sp.]MDO4920943.1 hypothetical protein [Phascolarctobacterium sp.]